MTKDQKIKKMNDLVIGLKRIVFLSQLSGWNGYLTQRKSSLEKEILALKKQKTQD